MYVCVCHTGTAHAGGSLVHEEIRAAAKLELRHRGAENGRQVRTVASSRCLYVVNPVKNGFGIEAPRMGGR